MKTSHGGRLHRACAGTVYAVLRQGADDELFSSPAGRDPPSAEGGASDSVTDEPGTAKDEQTCISIVPA